MTVRRTRPDMRGTSGMNRPHVFKRIASAFTDLTNARRGKS